MPYDMTDGGAAAYHRLQIEGREKLSISGYQGAASANFYTIYQQYFSEQQ